MNKIRGGNKALMLRQLRKYLEEKCADFGDLTLHNEVR